MMHAGSSAAGLARVAEAGGAMGAGPATAPAAALPSSSYREILKSSAWIGGSSMLNIVIGILRTKVLAVLLGPAGFGLLGLYASVLELARSVAQVGTNGSGVRQIAAAAATEDGTRIAQTITVLRRLVIVLGVLGAVALALLSQPIAWFTFGSGEQAGAIALLSLAVLLRLVADGQNALLQGLRRIADLAKAGVAGSLLGTLASIPLVWALGVQGVVPSLVAVAAATLAASWWYSRRVEIAALPPLGAARFRNESASLLKLGLAFMGSGLLMMGAAYAVRTLVLRDAGLEAAGLYQAAWTVGGLYVGLVLQAMGADFYPRLVAAAQDDERANRLVNEQTEVSLLLAAPGVLATLTLATAVMTLLYSEAFRDGVGLLRWICLGMALRVITWPMGYIIVARGRQSLFFATELAWTVVHLGLAWVCIARFGVDGAGMAFLGSYVFHGLMIYPIVRRIGGFRWTGANARAGGLFIGSIALVFSGLLFLPPGWGLALGLAATAASSAHALRSLLRMVSPESLPRSVQRGLGALRRFRTT